MSLRVYEFLYFSLSLSLSLHAYHLQYGNVKGIPILAEQSDNRLEGALSLKVWTYFVWQWQPRLRPGHNLRGKALARNKEEQRGTVWSVKVFRFCLRKCNDNGFGSSQHSLLLRLQFEVGVAWCTNRRCESTGHAGTPVPCVKLKGQMSTRRSKSEDPNTRRKLQDIAGKTCRSCL